MKLVIILSLLVWNFHQITNANDQPLMPPVMNWTKRCFGGNCAAAYGDYENKNNLVQQNPTILNSESGKANLSIASRSGPRNKLETAIYEKVEIVPIKKKNKRSSSERRLPTPQKPNNLQDQIAQMMKDAAAKMHGKP